MTQTIEKITLGLVRDTWEACYELDQPGLLAKLFDRPLTAVEVLTRQDGDWHFVPIADRLWVVLREGVLSDRVLRLFAAACAEKACQDAGWTDPRSVAAIQAARDFAVGKITAEALAGCGVGGVGGVGGGAGCGVGGVGGGVVEGGVGVGVGIA